MGKRIGYVVARFPVLSETFVVNEIDEIRRQGARVEVLPLLGSPDPIAHVAGQRIAAGAHYVRAASAVAAQLHWLFRRPRGYARAWARGLRGQGLRIRDLAAATIVIPLAAAQARNAERLAIDHIHAHFATHAALAAFVIRELTGIPFSVTAHSHDLTSRTAMLTEKLEAASAVVVISSYYRTHVCRLLGAGASGRVHVVRCGVDTRALRPASRATAREREGAPLTVIAPGRLVPMKGQRFLVEAAAALRRQGVRIRLVLAGHGPLGPELRDRAAALGIAEDVTLTGALEHRRMLAAIAAADIACLPSIVTPSGEQEGIPVALMEAMALGVPVVSTRTSGISELVRDGLTGLLVPPGDVGALALAIQRLVDDPGLRERLGRAGREAVERDYDLATNTGRLRELIEALP